MLAHRCRRSDDSSSSEAEHDAEDAMRPKAAEADATDADAAMPRIAASSSGSSNEPRVIFNFLRTSLD